MLHSKTLKGEFVCTNTFKGGESTFTTHPDLDALLEATILTLIPVMLIDGTVPRTSTRVREISSYGALEETLASFARELSVVLPGTFIAAYGALGAHLLLLLLLLLLQVLLDVDVAV